MSSTTPPPPAPPPPPPPPASPAPPSGGAAARVPWLDLKSIIAVLIGLVSVTGAVVTWRAAVLAETATDKDRQAVAETVLEQRSEATVEITLEAEERAFARHRAELVSAEQYDAQADALERSGDRAGAEAARAQATTHRRVADELSAVRDFAGYLVDAEDGAITFDVERRRADLLRNDQEAAQVDPANTIRQGNALRDQSQRLVGWIVVFVAAVVLLTVAQIASRRPFRVGFAGAAVVVYLAATVGALAAT